MCSAAGPGAGAAEPWRLVPSPRRRELPNSSHTNNISTNRISRIFMSYRSSAAAAQDYFENEARTGVGQ